MASNRLVRVLCYCAATDTTTDTTVPGLSLGSVRGNTRPYDHTQLSRVDSPRTWVL